MAKNTRSCFTLLPSFEFDNEKGNISAFLTSAEILLYIINPFVEIVQESQNARAVGSIQFLFK